MGATAVFAFTNCKERPQTRHGLKSTWPGFQLIGTGSNWHQLRALGKRGVARWEIRKQENAAALHDEVSNVSSWSLLNSACVPVTRKPAVSSHPPQPVLGRLLVGAHFDGVSDDQRVTFSFERSDEMNKKD